ncbi:hypothetical protein DYB37_002549 [Aphanomyces astaci]|uniref:Uncharacterized protein n=2 Tax=Aphanomyces astaci TaxID=112090 RepID=A0A3R7BQB2_APHAT|nr:hypothetical protein DYB34_002218 [Aphanomyces astaci]RHZ20168.1 hypothetical protein DYB37_002549 [Aphanomyces astaci]
MTKPKVIQLLVVYYLFAFAFFPIIALDTSSTVVATSPFACTGDGCSHLLAHTRVSPFCTHMSLVVSALSPASVALASDAPPFATATLSIETIHNGPSQSQSFTNWTTTTTSSGITTVESPPFAVDYDTLFGVDINLYSAVNVDLALDSSRHVPPLETLTMTWHQYFVSPYVTLYCSSTVMAVDVVSLGYFVHRVRMFRSSQPHVSLPQWWWIPCLLLSLMLQIQIPFAIAQFVFTMAGAAMPQALLQLSFWLYLVGKNTTRFFVLCFADGMDRTSDNTLNTSDKNSTVRFYVVKAATVAVLTIAQGVNYEWVLSQHVTDVLVLVITVLEFCTQGVMVLWYWVRRGREIRTFPYKTAKFRYVTYGVLSFLVVPEAIGSLITLMKRTTGTHSTPTAKSLAWLAALVRLQAFAWMVLKCYLPLKASQLLQTSPEHRSVALDDEADVAPSSAFRTFNLTTAVTMLNCSVTCYFDDGSSGSPDLGIPMTTESWSRGGLPPTFPRQPPSPSSFGRIGHDIIHPTAYNISVLQVFHDAATDTNALLLHDRESDRYILSFRGTGSLKNGLTDLKSRQVLFPGMRFKAQRGDLKRRYHRSDVYVHVGFLQAYMALQVDLHDAVRRLPRPTNQPLQLFCTGHSLGGALATLCALDMALAQPNVTVTMYNFGSPRVGNHTFQMLFNATVCGFRVVNDGDVVTQLPKRDYTGVDRSGVGIYKHVGVEVVLLSPGRQVDGHHSFRGIVVAPTIVDRVFVLAMRTKLSSHGLESYRQSFRSLIAHEPAFDEATLISYLNDADKNQTGHDTAVNRVAPKGMTYDDEVEEDDLTDGDDTSMLPTEMLEVLVDVVQEQVQTSVIRDDE